MFSFKATLFGDTGVGKTSLVSTLTGKPSSDPVTIGVEHALTHIQIKNNQNADVNCTLQIWDTDGAPDNRLIAGNYSRLADVLILVFDITNQASFDNLQNEEQWMKYVYAIKRDIPIILVGNKVDLWAQRQVSEDAAKQFAADNNMIYLEASALAEKGKVNESVKNIFVRAAQEAFKKSPQIESESKEEPVPLESIRLNHYFLTNDSRKSKSSSFKPNFFKAGFGTMVLYGLAAALCITLLAVTPWMLIGLVVPLGMMAYGHHQEKKKRGALRTSIAYAAVNPDEHSFYGNFSGNDYYYEDNSPEISQNRDGSTSRLEINDAEETEVLMSSTATVGGLMQTVILGQSERYDFTPPSSGPGPLKRQSISRTSSNGELEQDATNDVVKDVTDEYQNAWTLE